jgi:hypothetical protein
VAIHPRLGAAAVRFGADVAGGALAVQELFDEGDAHAKPFGQRPL